MTTLVDANVLLDIITEDEQWMEWSADALSSCAARGDLAINPIVHAEVSLGYDTIEALDDALRELTRLALPYEAGFLAARCYVRYEAVVDRSVGVPKSPPKPPPPAEPVAAGAHAPDVQTAEPRRVRLLRRVSLRRTARGARAVIVLQPGSNAAHVHGRLMHRGSTIAVAARDVHAQRAVLRFHGARDLPAGTYTLLVRVVDDAGLVATRRRRVTLA